MLGVFIAVDHKSNVLKLFRKGSIVNKALFVQDIFDFLQKCKKWNKKLRTHRPTCGKLARSEG